MNINPAIIAASIAGGGIGTAAGVMIKGEQLEHQGASNLEQMTRIIPNGLQGGIIGAGIGAGASGTAVALRAIFRK